MAGVGAVNDWVMRQDKKEKEPTMISKVIAGASQAIDDVTQILDPKSKTSGSCLAAIQGPNGEIPQFVFGGIMAKQNLKFHTGPHSGNPLITGLTSPGGGANATMDIYSPFVTAGNYPNQRTVRVGRKNVVLTLRQFQAMVLFHEISHATGRYHHPGNRAPLTSKEISNDDLDSKVYTDCIKGSHIPRK
jgi:hypothetical protein